MHEKIKKLFQSGQTEAALQKMGEEYGDKEISVLMSKYRSAKTPYNLGIIDFSEMNKIQSQVVYAALNILEEKATQKAAQQLGDAGQIKEGRIPSQRLKVFLSYAHKDEDIKEQLDTHLAGLKRSHLIETWNDRKIIAGTEWDEEIKAQLTEADIILLLVSASFIASEYIWKYELKKAMERHERKEAVVIPIFMKACDWKDMPFAKIQGLPRDARPVMAFSDRDEALMQVAKGIRNVVDRLT